MGTGPPAEVQVNLDAVIVAVTDERPRVLTVVDGRGTVSDADRAVVSGRGGAAAGGARGAPAAARSAAGLHLALPRLPSGPLEPTDRTLDRALRRFVRQQAGLEVGYVEQLYTFGDLERAGRPDRGRLLSIAYLALVRESRPSAGAVWLDWYDLYPWEDYRDGQPGIVEDEIEPAVNAWVAEAVSAAERARREERATMVFGLSGVGWDGVRVLERYELLYELGLLAESTVPASQSMLPDGEVGAERSVPPSLGLPMQLDHRRIVATALGRLRGKLTYRPVVFELLPPAFTLFQLQGLVEALSGVRLHKQNFRRLVERAGLVEGTGELARTGGRPAELFRFRREVLRERPRPGFGTPWARM